ncbi:MAG: MFS transporter [Eubacteriales bacterium]|nr:MFS transporter [Clostridium sp.]MDY6081024.1 MFS transporter [Eubacteriales bacterium]
MESRSNSRVIRIITIAILSALFAYGFVGSISNVLVNEIIDAFSLTGTAQGLSASLMNMGSLIALFVTPLLQGRIRKTKMIVLSGLLQVAALCVAGSAAGFILFATANAVTGIGCGWLDTYANSCIVDLHPQNSTRYLGWLHGLFGVGSLIAPLAIRWILGWSNWRGVYFAFAGVMLLSVGCIAFTSRKVENTGALSNTQESRLTLKEVGAYLTVKRNVLLLLTTVMTNMVQTGLTCWIARYMFLAYGEVALGATCLTLFWIAATASRFVMPRLKLRPLTIVMVGAFCATVLLSGGILSGSATVMCVAVCLCGFVTGPFMPMLIAECATGYQGKTTLTTSLMMIVGGVARLAMPLLTASVTSAVSAIAGMLVPAAFAVLAGVLSLAALRTTTTPTAHAD